MHQFLKVAAKLPAVVCLVTAAIPLQAANPPYKIAETDLAVGGISAIVDTTSLAVPKNTASAVRVKVLAGDRVLDADAVRDLLGGPFSLSGELSGPGLSQTVTLPAANAPTLADPFLLPVPPLSVGGEYSLTSVRVVVDGATVLDAAPRRVTFQVIDQILITSVKTQQLTPEQLRDKGVVLGADAFMGFQFTVALLMHSTPVEISLPVVFDRQGVAMPPVIPLPPPITRQGERLPPLPFLAPILLDDSEDDGTGGGSSPTLTFPDGRPVRIPSLLVIPGDVTYLKAHFAAQLFVANGAPLGTTLQVHDVTGTVKLPTPNPDPALVLAPLVSGPQPATMPVRGVGPDGLPGTADDVEVLGPGEQGMAEFVLRAELEGFHKLDFDISATLDGLPVGPVTVRGTARGGVLVRNPRFNMSFAVPNVVRNGESFSFFTTVTNIGQTTAYELKVNLDMAGLSGATLLCPPAEEPCNSVTIPFLEPGDAKTLEFVMESQRTGAVVASYINFSDSDVRTGLNFTLGVGERGILHSPDTLVMPAGVDLLPAPVVRAAMRVLGQAWSIATAPPDRPTPGVTPIDERAVLEKAHALAEAGLRRQLQQSQADAVRDLVLDFYGGQPLDPGFDELLRQTRAGRDFAQALGAALASAAGSGASSYERTLSEVAASGPDFLAFSVAGTAGAVEASLHDASERTTVSGRSTTQIAASEIPGAAWIPLGTPDSAPMLGVLTAPVAGQTYTLDVSGAASLSMTLPRPDETFLHAAVTTTHPARMTVDLAQGAVTLKEDRDADGTYESTVTVATSSLASAGPRLVSATVIGDETLEIPFPFGMNVALLFDRPVDPTHAADLSRYHMVGNAVTSAKAQLSGRIVFANLQAPEGRHIPVRIAVDAMADVRGMLGQAADQPLASRMTAPGAVVSGHVLNADGTPYVGGQVYYLNAVGLPPWCHEAIPNKAIAVTTVGADGRYEFRYVKQDPCGGSFKMLVRDPVNGAERSVFTFVRHDGEQLVLDLVLIGRGALQGTVRSAANVPVAGARVVALSVSDPSMGGGAVTDGAGHYTIYNLPVGAFNVTAGLGVHMGRAAGRIDQAGQTATVDVRLESGAARISGRVSRLDPGQSAPVPIPGIHVVYFQGVAVGPNPLGVVQTDAEGKYVLEGMPSGQFTLLAALNRRDQKTLTDYVTEGGVLVRDLVIEIKPEATYGSVTGTVRLPNGAPAEGVIVGIGGRGVLTGADGRYTLSGLTVPQNPQIIAKTRDGQRVGYRFALLTDSNRDVENIDITLSGLGTAVFTVLSPSGQPMSGQPVSLMGACGNPCGCATKVSGLDGRVTFPNLRMGTAAANAVRYVTGGVDQTAAGVTLSQDGATAYGVLRFGGLGTVTGFVKTASGEPVVGAMVYVTANQFRNDGAWTCALVADERPEIRTGPDGRFTLSNVNAGPVSVIARQEFMTGVAYASGTLLGGQTLDLTMQLSSNLAGRLSGAVFLPDGTTPAGANIEVTVNGPLPDVTVRTNADGQYSFPEILTQGRYTMTVRDAASGGLARSWVWLRAGQDMTHDVRLLGKGTITVRVVDGAGRVADSARVRVQQTDYPNRTYEAQAQASINDGVVEFPGVFQGRFSVEASDVYGRGGRISANLANPGDTAEVTVRLTVTGSIQGRFLMPDAITPIAYGTIRLIAGGRVIGQTTSSGSGDTGSYSFDYVPAGPVRIEASDPKTARTGFAVGTIETQDQELTLDVRAQGLGTVQGTITSNGVGQPSALVEIVSGAYRANTMADGSGVYVVHGVPEGRVTVSASLEHGLLKASSAATLTGEGSTVTIDVALRPTGTVVGTVKKADNVTPALSVVALASGGEGGGRFARTTTADGDFDFERVPAGTADVTVDAIGSIDAARARVDVPAGETLQLPLRLNGVGRLHGVARNSQGVPTDGALHIMVSGAFYSNFSFRLGPDGLFDIPQVLAGPFTARLTVGSGALALYGTVTGTIPADGEKEIDIQVQDSGTVTGLIVRSDGVTPAYGANVTIEHERGSVMVQAQNDGRFALKGVPMGAFKVRVKDEVTTGLATLRNQSLTTNGQVLDVGTLVLDDVPPTATMEAPVDGSTQKAVGVFMIADLADVGSGIDTSSVYVRYPSGGVQLGTNFTVEGNASAHTVRVSGQLSATYIGTNTFWLGFRDLAGNLTEKKVTYTSTGMTVSGTVRWSDGTPAAGIELDFGPGHPTKPVTGGDGTYSLGGFGPGGAGAWAKDPTTGIKKYTSVPVYDGEDATLDVTMPAYGFIRGVVTRADGTPAAGATVAASTWPVRQATTDASGRFDLGAFSIGPTYGLTATDARGDKAQTSVTFSTAGQVLQAALKFTGVGTVTVTVLDGTSPAQGVAVRVKSSSLIASYGDGTTGADGRVVIPGILAGTITATATDSVRQLSGEAAPVVMSDGGTPALTIALEAAGRVAGRVRRADGTAAANIDVTLNHNQRETKTDANGDYAFEPVKLGAFTVQAKDAATGDFAQKEGVLFGANTTAVADMTLNGVGTVRVTVKDASDAVVSEAHVFVHHPAARWGYFHKQAGTDGVAEFTNVFAGTIRVTATNYVIGGELPPTTLAPGASLDLVVTMQPAGTIRGKVLEPDGVTPVAGAEVRLNYFRVTTTLSDGSYAFTQVPLGNNQNLAAAVNGRPRARREGLALTNGQVLDVDLILVGIGRVSGLVTNAANAVVSGATVTLQSQGYPFAGGPFVVSTGADGRYAMEAVPIGPFAISAAKGIDRVDLSGAIENHGDAPTIDLQLLSSAVQLPRNLYDGNEQMWQVKKDGSVTGPNEALYNSPVLTLFQNGAAIPFAPNTTTVASEEGKREVIVTQSLAGLNVQRKVYIPHNGYFIRYLDVLENPGATPVTVDVLERSRFSFNGANVNIYDTSSGDTVADDGDQWVAVDEAEDNLGYGDWRYAPMGIVFGGPGGQAPSDVRFDKVAASEQYLSYRWNTVTVAPGQRVGFLHMYTYQARRWRLEPSVERLRQIPPEILLGVSASEAALVRNFAVPASLESALPALAPFDGLITGQALAGDGVTPVPDATVTFESAVAHYGRQQTVPMLESGGNDSYEVRGFENDVDILVVPRDPFDLTVSLSMLGAQAVTTRFDFPRTGVRNLTNLAGATVRASSSYSSYYGPGKAVDTSLNTMWEGAADDHSDAPYLKTPYLEVGLPEDATIHMVKVRGRCCDGYDGIRRVRVELRDSVGTVLHSQEAEFPDQPRDGDVAMTAPVAGVRAVRLVSLAEAKLSLRELEVWGESVSGPSRVAVVHPRFDGYGLIAGRVLRADGTPVDHAKVTLIQGAQSSYVFSATDGAYLLGVVSPGDYEIEAVHPHGDAGAPKVRVPTSVTANTKTTRDLVFPAFGSLQVVFLTAAGQSTYGQVNITNPQGYYRYHTGNVATYTFDDLPAGLYTLRATDVRNGTIVTETVDVAAGPPTVRNVTFPVVGVVDVVARLKGTSTPVAGAVYWRSAAHPNEKYAGTADALGRLTIDKVSGPTFTIKVVYPGNTNSFGEATATFAGEADRLTVTVDVPGEGTIAGVLRGRDGAPITLGANGKVGAWHATNETKFAEGTTDASGAFSIPKVPIGPVRLRAQATESYGGYTVHDLGEIRTELTTPNGTLAQDALAARGVLAAGQRELWTTQIPIDTWAYFSASGSGATPPDVYLEVYGPDGAVVASNDDRSASDKGPNLSFKTLAPGEYVVSVRAKEATSGPYRLSSCCAYDHQYLRLPTTAAVHGRVVHGPTGAPVPAATVRLTIPSTSETKTVTTAADGTYVFPTVPVETAVVVALLDNAGLVVHHVDITTGAAATATSAPLTRPGLGAVVVRSTYHGEPHAGLGVSITSNGGTTEADLRQRTGATAADGAVTFTGIVIGTITATATDNTSLPITRTGELAEGSTLTIELALTDVTAPAAITLSATSPSMGVAVVSWTAPGDDGTTGTAAAYDLRYSTNPIDAGNFAAATALTAPAPATAGTTQSVQAALPVGFTYYFAIKSRDAAGNVSALSNVPSLQLLDTVAPSAVTDLAATSPAQGVVRLHWTAPGDDGTSGTAHLYEIRSSTSPITEANFLAADPVLVAVPAPAASGTLQTVDIPLTAGQVYYFALKTSDERPNWSAISNIATYDLPDAFDGTVPAAITDLAASSPQTGTVSLAWTSPGDDGAVGTATAYDVRYATAPITEANFAQASALASPPAPLAAGTAQAMQFTLPNNQAYYFAIKTRDEVDNWSALSNVAQVSLGDTTPPAAITNLVAVSPAAGIVSLSWTAPGDDGNSSVATAYDIRYSTAPITAGNFAGATPVVAPLPLGAGTAQSVDVPVAGGQAYDFAMKTGDEVPNWSALSNVAGLTVGALPPGAKLWVKADAGISKDATGLVSSWADQSGNGNNLTMFGSLAPTPTPIPSSTASIQVNGGTTPIEVAPGATVTVNVAGGPGYTTDSIAVAAASSAPTTKISWMHLNGSQTAPATGVTSATVTFTMPTTPGHYNFRFLQQNGSTMLAISPLVSVVPTTRPSWRAAEVNGQPVVRFDGVDDNLLFNTRLTGIRTVFWAIRETPNAPNGWRCLLGDTITGNTYHFHGGAAHEIWSSAYTHDSVKNGETYLNGARVDGLATNRPTSVSVVSVVTTAGATAAQFSRDRTSADRSWNGDLAELIIYERALSAAERKSVEDYLAARYAAYPLERPVITPNGGRITAPTTVTMAAAAGTEIRYTLDGTEPTASSTPYAAAINVTGTTTVKAKVFLGLRSSATAVAAFVGDETFHPAQVAGLKLWVRADSGIQETDGRVSQWTDATGTNGAMTQSDWKSRPARVTNATTGKPAVKFDGNDDFMMLPERLTTIQTVFWVIHEEPSTPNGYRFLLGDASTSHFYSGSLRQIWSTSASASVTGGETRLNGAFVNGTTTNRPTTPSVVSLVTTGPVTADSFGRGYSTVRWNGELAELIIYDRALTRTERKAVEDYLALRYNTFVPTLNAPRATPNGGLFTGSQTVSLSANQGAAIRYTLDGSEPTAASPLYTEPLTISTTTTVKAKAFQSGWATSPIAVVGFTNSADFHPATLSGLQMWMRADAGIEEVGGLVSNWTDQSTANNHLTQSVASPQPTFVASGLDGRPTVRFDGALDFLAFTAPVTTIRTVFWVVNETLAAPNAYRFLLGHATGYDFHGGSAHQIWSSSSNASVRNGTTRMNGVAVDGLSTNRPTAPSVLSLVTTGAVAADNFSRDRGNASRSWNGDLAELVIYDRALTDAERAQVEQYLAAKHGITLP